MIRESASTLSRCRVAGRVSSTSSSSTSRGLRIRGGRKDRYKADWAVRGVAKEDDVPDYFLRGWPRKDTAPVEGSRVALAKRYTLGSLPIEEEWGRRKEIARKESKRERARGPARIARSSLRVEGKEAVCRRNGCLGWGRTRLEGRPEDEDGGG